MTSRKSKHPKVMKSSEHFSKQNHQWVSNSHKSLDLFKAE